MLHGLEGECLCHLVFFDIQQNFSKQFSKNWKIRELVSAVFLLRWGWSFITWLASSGNTLILNHFVFTSDASFLLSSPFLPSSLLECSCYVSDIRLSIKAVGESSSPPWLETASLRQTEITKLVHVITPEPFSPRILFPSIILLELTTSFVPIPNSIPGTLPLSTLSITRLFFPVKKRPPPSPILGTLSHALSIHNPCTRHRKKQFISCQCQVFRDARWREGDMKNAVPGFRCFF